MSKDFHSSLARELEQFVTHMHALGYSYHRAAATLKSFDRYVLTHAGRQRTLPLASLLRGWLSRRGARKPVTVAMDLGTLRQFFRYRCRFDPDGFIPGREWAPQAAKSDFVPHVFSLNQIRALLDEAGRLRCNCRARAVMRALILILYCTGLRFGEAIRLEIQDVDLHRHLFHIRESKGKTRWVPFRADLARELRKYRKQRDQIAAIAPCAAFLVRPDGSAFSVKGASGIIRGMLRRLGLKPRRGRTGPRPYDLRHAYAVHRLISWHRAGVDVHAKFPWLSAYLGHDNILGTEVYLHATTELLQLASSRFHSRLHRTETP
ncbi:MAG: tyrosine-type recombinase/integrase [Thermoguttaceae bacterium]|jgi:site-specific recombinase XerD